MRPDLGFIPVTVTPSVAASFSLDTDRGVLAAQVEPLNVAGQAGLQPGDVITAVDHVQIYNVGDFWHAYLRSGDPLPAQLTIYGRNGQNTVALPRDPFSSVSKEKQDK